MCGSYPHRHFRHNSKVTNNDGLKDEDHGLNPSTMRGLEGVPSLNGSFIKLMGNPKRILGCFSNRLVENV